MRGFVRIPDETLRLIAGGKPGTPTLYHTGNPLVRRLFWRRLELIHRLIITEAGSVGSCLDFGGGGGVFLPTLAGLFRQVTCVDLDTDEAERVVRRFRLENVTLVRGNFARVDLSQAPFDAIIAADVLEHFRDVHPSIVALRRWLRDDGTLFTSLPSESRLYRWLRRAFRVEPPEDHYQVAREVELALAAGGFSRKRGVGLPLGRHLFPLFLIGAWGKCATPTAGTGAERDHR